MPNQPVCCTYLLSAVQGCRIHHQIYCLQEFCTTANKFYYLLLIFLLAFIVNLFSINYKPNQSGNHKNEKF